MTVRAYTDATSCVLFLLGASAAPERRMHAGKITVAVLPSPAQANQTGGATKSPLSSPLRKKYRTRLRNPHRRNPGKRMRRSSTTLLETIPQMLLPKALSRQTVSPELFLFTIAMKIEVNGAGHSTALPQGITAFYLFICEE